MCGCARLAAFALSVCAFAFACSCAEGDAVIRKKLDLILEDDLAAILEDVSKEALIDKPCFELLEYKEYSEGAYSRMAVADFFFMKPLVGMEKKITRKYRYHRRQGQWDRYFNKYFTVAPENASPEGAAGAGD
jgi:hypothetical protein